MREATVQQAQIVAWVAARYPCDFPPEVRTVETFPPDHPQARTYTHRFTVDYGWYTGRKRKRYVLVAIARGGAIREWAPV